MWTAKKQWNRSQLDRERQEFFDTRVTGHAEIWATLKVVVGLLADGDITTAQSILDAAAITVPTGDLKNGAYDEAGNLYQMPEHVISDPQNVVLNQQEEDKKGGIPNEATDDDDDGDDDAIERKREEKGKSVLKNGDLIKVRARLSDRGGPDVVIPLGKDQVVRMLVRRVQEEANVRLKVLHLTRKHLLTLRIDDWERKSEDCIYGQNPRRWGDFTGTRLARRSCRQCIGI